ncbi:MAG: SPOR domain-containing protein [Arenimonas sp.]
MAKKVQARRQGSKGTPAWAWLLAGLLIGALAYFGYLQYKLLSAPPPSDVPVPQAGKTAVEDAEPGVEPPASGTDDGVLDTDYSFYDVLPTQETVDVPAAETADPTAPVADGAAANPEDTAAKPPTETAKPAEEARYLLQAGAFERNADADDLKARIALAGETARVETAEVNGKTVYRVRLGPYPNARAAEAAKANLAGIGIAAASIKVK